MVGRVEHAVNDAVGKGIRATTAPGEMALQAAKMIFPALIFATNKLGECELMNDIGEISRETLPRQAFHIFEDEGLGLCFAHDAHRLGPHIAAVAVGAMLPPSEKGWQGGPPVTNSIFPA